MSDAIVVGAGPNGLVAANLLVDAGWDVLVVEAAQTPGGAVRSGELVEPGFESDLCSAFYPLAAVSPALRSLDLQRFGLRWRHAPLVLAHPLPDGRAAVLSRDVSRTAASLEEFAPGDGQAWLDLYDLWRRIGPHLVDALFTPFPPVRAGLRTAAQLRAAGLLRFVRFGLLPVRRLGEERFRGEGGRVLLAGNTMHTDLGPDAAGGAVFGWLLAMLGQEVGFPVPVGGAGRLTDALVARLQAAGGRLRTGAPVVRILVEGGRAVGVVTQDGTEHRCTRAVLADVDAPQLYGRLVAREELPDRFVDDLEDFQWDLATVKVDWTLDAPVPWTAAQAGQAGTVHLGGDMDEMTRYSADLATGRVPARPFLLVGQMTTSDPSRSPAGTETLWAYTHVPRVVRGDAGGSGVTGTWDEADRAAVAERIEARIEEYAPGFRARIRARAVQLPTDLQAKDANLSAGAVNGGTAAIHQQLLFRPVPGLGRPETPIRGLFLASASAHPGGGVHGACGSNAVRSALLASSRRRLVTSPLLRAAEHLLQG